MSSLPATKYKEREYMLQLCSTCCGQVERKGGRATDIHCKPPWVPSCLHTRKLPGTTTNSNMKMPMKVQSIKNFTMGTRKDFIYERVQLPES